MTAMTTGDGGTTMAITIGAMITGETTTIDAGKELAEVCRLSHSSFVQRCEAAHRIGVARYS